MYNREKKLENLKLTIKIMNLFHLKWWITAGTLLGIVRENNFLAHDKDVDIGVPAQYIILWDYLIKAFQEEGFALKHEWKVKKQKISLAFTREEEKVDLYFFFDEGKFSYHYVFGPSEKHGWDQPDVVANVFAKQLFQQLKEIDFKGISVFVPSDPLTYIKTRYGDGWCAPDPGYNYFTGCKARREGFGILGENK